MKIRMLLALLVSLFLACVPSPQPPRALAIWDFDGTIIKGDCSEGLSDGGVTIYAGIAERAIRAGFSRQYQGEAGVREFFRKYQELLQQGKSSQAYRLMGQIFAGAKEEELQKFCEGTFAELSGFYFADALRTWKQLQEEGVENHVISASCEIFVRGAAASLGIPAEWIHGIQIRSEKGILTDEILEPMPFGEGKVTVMRAIEQQRRGKAVHGFGNSKTTDGPFLREILRQGGNATFINPQDQPENHPEHLRFVKWTELAQDLK